AQGAAAAAPITEANAKINEARYQGDYTKAVKKLIEDKAEDYPVFLATGANFADALAAGPAAANEGGVVLLTEGATLGAAAKLYVDNAEDVIAIGGDAATAAGSAADDTYVGKDRY